jgi:hypothetical protein
MPKRAREPDPCEMPERAEEPESFKLSMLERLIPERKIFGLIFKCLKKSEKCKVISAEFNFSLAFGVWEKRPEYKKRAKPTQEYD